MKRVDQAKTHTSPAQGKARVGITAESSPHQTPASTDLLILSDGTILAHNLTPEMASLLKRLNELTD